MALNFASGFWSDTGSPSVPHQVTVGFQPKAVYIYDSSVASGYGSGATYICHGWATAVGNDSSVRQKFDVPSVSYQSVHYADLLGAMQGSSTLVAFNSTGFTVDPWGDTSWSFYWMAWGGDNLQANAGSFTINATSTADVVETGVGFQPDFLIATGVSPELSADYCQGMASSPTNQATCAMWGYLFGGNGNRFESGHLLTSAQTATKFLAALKTFDSDGFTVSVSQNLHAESREYYYLALKDTTTQFKVGVNTQKTSSGTKATTGVGFRPGGGIFMSTELTSANGHNGTLPCQLSWGQASGGVSPFSRLMWTQRSTPSQWGRSVTGSVISSSTNNTTNAEAELDSFDADGFTLDWITADATARYFLYGVWESSAYSLGRKTSFDKVVFPQ